MPLLIDAPLLFVALVGALHVLGERRATRLLRRPRTTRERWRAASFYAGLAVIVGALASPIDTLSENLFWVHMVQHVMLLSIAAPLVVLGAPWMSIWRPLPLEVRRMVARWFGRAPGAAPLRALGRLLARPVPVWILFNANLVLWHVPAIYDRALRDVAVHDLEHTTFLLFGTLLWAQVLDSPPLRRRMSAMARVWYMVATGVVGWVLSLVLAFALSPLYPFYEHLAHRPGAISALADQQIAAGVMLVPGSLSVTLFVFIQLYLWLGRGERTRPTTVAAPAAPGSGPSPAAGHPVAAELVPDLTVSAG